MKNKNQRPHNLNLAANPIRKREISLAVAIMVSGLPLGLQASEYSTGVTPQTQFIDHEVVDFARDYTYTLNNSDVARATTGAAGGTGGSAGGASGVGGSVGQVGTDDDRGGQEIRHSIIEAPDSTENSAIVSVNTVSNTLTSNRGALFSARVKPGANQDEETLSSVTISGSTSAIGGAGGTGGTGGAGGPTTLTGGGAGGAGGAGGDADGADVVVRADLTRDYLGVATTSANNFTNAQNARIVPNSATQAGIGIQALNEANLVLNLDALATTSAQGGNGGNGGAGGAGGSVVTNGGASGSDGGNGGVGGVGGDAQAGDATAVSRGVLSVSMESLATNNVVANNGTVRVNSASDAIGIQALALSDSQISAAARARSTATTGDDGSSGVGGNSNSTSGFSGNDGGSGGFGGNGGSASYGAVSADALADLEMNLSAAVLANTVNNSGSLGEVDGDLVYSAANGIALRADANARATVRTLESTYRSIDGVVESSGLNSQTRDIQGQNSVSASAIADVSLNTVTNSGNIFATNNGIGLIADASSDIGTSTYQELTGDFQIASGSSYADALVGDNAIVNAGTILVSGENTYGINLSATAASAADRSTVSYTDAISGNSQAYATVVGNQVTNTGGLLLQSSDEAQAIRLSAIANNSTNIGGVDTTQVVAAVVEDNSVNSSGLIQIALDSSNASGHAVNIQAVAHNDGRGLVTNVDFGGNSELLLNKIALWDQVNTQARVLENSVTLSGTATISSPDGASVDGDTVGKGVNLSALSVSDSNLVAQSSLSGEPSYETSFEASAARVDANTVISSADMNITAYRAVGIDFDSRATINISDNEYMLGFVALSSVDENAITNSGNISLLGEDMAGIRLSARAEANSSGGEGYELGNTGLAISSVSGNTIENSGSILITDSDPFAPGGLLYTGSGIELLAVSVVVRDNFIEGYGDDFALALVDNNEITNSGTLITQTGRGLYLYADAQSEGVSTAEVNSNTITNSGTLISLGEGIHLNAYAKSYSSGPAAASVVANEIINSGSLTSQTDDGINLDAYAYSNDGVATALINENTITNSGTIRSEDEGILLRSYAESYIDGNATASINSNTIISSGGLTGDTNEGIFLNADAITENGTSTTNVNANIVTNNGTLLSLNEGIRLSADAFSNISGNAIASVNTNIITNSGRLTSTEDRGVYLSANADANDGTSFSTVNSNIIINSGVIATDIEGGENAGQGIYIVADSSSSASATAEVADNTITNSGTLTAATDEGIYLDANASSGISVATAKINSNTITNSGSLFADNEGIRLTAFSDSDQPESLIVGLAEVNDNTVTNSGLLTAGDDGIQLNAIAYSFSGAAISQVNGNTIVNDGRIESGLAGILLQAQVAAYSSDAIALIDDNTITNNGTVVAQTDGIRLSAFSTDGLDQDWVSYIDGEDSIVNNNRITNRGSIYAKQTGINLKAFDITGNTIVNQGTLVAQGQGISLGGDIGGSYTTNSILDNTIEVSSSARVISGGHGISLDGGDVAGNSITISGLVVADRQVEVDNDRGFIVNGSSYTKSSELTWNRQEDLLRAVSIVGNAYGEDNGLSISAPAYLAGEIYLERDANVALSLTSGLGNSVRWSVRSDAEGPAEQLDHENTYTWKSSTTATKAQSLGGTVPWFIKEDALDTRNGQYYDVYATIDPTVFAASANQAADLTGAVSGLMNQGMVANKDRQHTIWLAAVGHRLDYDGNRVDTQDYKTTLGSYALGYSYKYNSDWLFGGLLGVTDSTVKVGSNHSDIFKNSYDNKANGGFISLNAGTKVYGFDLNLGVSAGQQDHEDKRFVNDNLNWWGVSYANAKYTSQWLAPEFTLAYPWQVQTGLVFKPNVNVRYTTQRIDGYTEYGSESNATVNQRNLGIVDTTVGLDLTKTYGKSSLTARVAHVQRSYSGDNQVRVSMFGDTRDISVDSANTSAVQAGLLWKLNLANDLDMYVNGNYIHGSTVKGANGNVSLRLQF